MSDETEITFAKGAGFKEIVMDHVIRLLKLNCVEFRGGHYTTVTTQDDKEIETYTPDTRSPFCNGVIALTQLLHHKFKDEKMKETWKKFNESLNELKKKIGGDEGVVFGEGFYFTDDEKKKLETYRIKKLDLCVNLFGEVLDMLGSINWLQMGTSTFGDNGEE